MKLKRSRTLLLVLGLFFVACNQEEDYIEKQRYFQQEQKFKISYLNKKAIHEASFLREKISRITEFNNSLNRVVYDSIYDFYIDTDKAILIESDSVSSYTFSVVRPENTVQTENLVILTKNDSTKMYLVDYEQDLNVVKNMTASEAALLTPLFYELNGTTDKCSMTVVCVDTYTYEYGVPCNEGNNTGGEIYCEGWVLQSTSCSLVGCGGGSGSDPGDPGLPVPGTDSSGGSGGSGGNTGGTAGGENYDDGLVDPGTCKGCGEVVTVPLPELELENALGTTPCDNLKELSDPNKQNINTELNSLKQQHTNDPSKEHGIQFNCDTDANPYVYSNIPAPNFADYVNYVKGWTWRGGAHTHPKHGYSMFSWGDVQTLAGSYDYASPENKPYVVNIVICFNPNTNHFDTYAIKVDDYATLQAALDTDWNDPVYAVPPSADPEKDKEDKIKKIHADQENIFKLAIKDNPLLNNDEALELAFLQQFADHGISLYKINTTTNNWEKLTLNSNTILKTPCN